MTLPPWTDGAFELLQHAESHLRSGEDFDRRIALISFDNAIEVAIATYLTLHPSLRGRRTYEKAEVEKWLKDYHTKLEFLEAELVARGIDWAIDKDHIIWAHQHRNEQYHGGNKGIPEQKVLSIIRRAALWIIGVLFDIAEPDEELAMAMADAAPPPPPQRLKSYDLAIDGKYGLLQVGDQTFYASELLFSVDYDAYRDLGNRLTQTPQAIEEEEGMAQWAH